MRQVTSDIFRHSFLCRSWFVVCQWLWPWRACSTSYSRLEHPWFSVGFRGDMAWMVWSFSSKNGEWNQNFSDSGPLWGTTTRLYTPIFTRFEWGSPRWHRNGLVQAWGKAIDRGEPMVNTGEMAQLRGWAPMTFRRILKSWLAEWCWMLNDAEMTCGDEHKVWFINLSMNLIAKGKVQEQATLRAWTEKGVGRRWDPSRLIGSLRRCFGINDGAWCIATGVTCCERFLWCCCLIGVMSMCVCSIDGTDTVRFHPSIQLTGVDDFFEAVVLCGLFRAWQGREGEGNGSKHCSSGRFSGVGKILKLGLRCGGKGLDLHTLSWVMLGHRWVIE